jgi:hypothetical protein
VISPYKMVTPPSWPGLPAEMHSSERSGSDDQAGGVGLCLDAEKQGDPDFPPSHLSGRRVRETFAGFSSSIDGNGDREHCMSVLCYTFTCDQRTVSASLAGLCAVCQTCN